MAHDVQLVQEDISESSETRVVLEGRPLEHAGTPSRTGSDPSHMLPQPGQPRGTSCPHWDPMEVQHGCKTELHQGSWITVPLRISWTVTPWGASFGRIFGPLSSIPEICFEPKGEMEMGVLLPPVTSPFYHHWVSVNEATLGKPLRVGDGDQGKGPGIEGWTTQSHPHFQGRGGARGGINHQWPMS